MIALSTDERFAETWQHADVESLDHEGRGVAHVDGKVVFIEGALPREQVVYEPSRRKKFFDQAKLIRVEKSAPERVTPRCNFYEICGGCAMQHIDPALQVAAKQRVLEDNLARIGRVLVDRQVLLVTLSYFLMNYVFYLVTFWSFLYLRQERQMTMLESGWLASLPFASAAVATVVGGKLSDSMIARWGTTWGVRVLPLVSDAELLAAHVAGDEDTLHGCFARRVARQIASRIQGNPELLRKRAACIEQEPHREEGEFARQTRFASGKLLESALRGSVSRANTDDREALECAVFSGNERLGRDGPVAQGPTLVAAV